MPSNIIFFHWRLKFIKIEAVIPKLTKWVTDNETKQLRFEYEIEHSGNIK